jgi:hypothetical protein
MKQTGIFWLLGLLLALATRVSWAKPSEVGIHHTMLRGDEGGVLPSIQSTTTVIAMNQLLATSQHDRSLASTYGGDFWLFQDPSTWTGEELAIFVFVAILISILLCFSICCCFRCRFSLWDVFAIFCCWEICCDDGRMIRGGFDSALV